MAWIQSHDTLESSIKLQQFCELSGLSKFEAIGFLHVFWHWVLKQKEDGDISQMSSDSILWGIGYPKDRLKDDLKTILRTSCFMDEDGFLHDWMDYVGKFLYSKYHSANKSKYDLMVSKWNLRIGSPKDIPKVVPKDSPKDDPDKIIKDKIIKDNIIKEDTKENNNIAPDKPAPGGLGSQKASKAKAPVPKPPSLYDTYASREDAIRAKALNCHQRMIYAYKALSGHEWADVDWDKLNWGRCLKAIKVMESLDCVQGLTDDEKVQAVVDCAEQLKGKGLSFTLETIAREIPDWYTEYSESCAIKEHERLKDEREVYSIPNGMMDAIKNKFKGQEQGREGE